LSRSQRSGSVSTGPLETSRSPSTWSRGFGQQRKFSTSRSKSLSTRKLTTTIGSWSFQASIVFFRKR
jgi:hypothetical protein